MIDSATAAISIPNAYLHQSDKLSPAKEAEKARIEARLAVLEEKIESEKISGLDPDEEDQLKRLQERDAEVRSHEMAHLAAAGSLAIGGMNLVYQTGPDGRPYAVGGSVQIDTSKGRTPEETIEKAQRIRAAALAPSDPSPKDMQVAAKASQLEAEARAELAEEKRSETQASDSRQATIYGQFAISDPSRGSSETRDLQTLPESRL